MTRTDTPHHNPAAKAAPKGRRPGGFTLIEVLLALSVLAILASVGFPALGRLVDASLCENIARKAGADALFARSEAVKRNQAVLMCPGVAGNCPANPSIGDWSSGWRVCYDADTNGQCDSPAPNDPNPLRVQSAWSSRASVSGPPLSLRFNADGSLNVNGLGIFTIRSGPAASPGWTVQLASSGTVTVRREAT